MTIQTEERLKIVTHLQKLQVFDTFEKTQSDHWIKCYILRGLLSSLTGCRTTQLEVAVKFRNEPKSDWKGCQFSSNLYILFFNNLWLSSPILLPLRNTWKTRNTGMKKTWLKSWKVLKVSKSSSLLSSLSIYKNVRVCPFSPASLSASVFVCWKCSDTDASLWCFLCGKERLLWFGSGLVRPCP